MCCRNSHVLQDASLRYEAWMDLLREKKGQTGDRTRDNSMTCETLYIACKEGLGAKIDRITPVSQPRAERFCRAISFCDSFWPSV